MKFLPFVVLIPALHAAVTISGTVLEKQSGHALARATVTATPVGGKPSDARTARSNENGRFEIKVAPGSYVVSASKLAFAPVQYGQKRWRAAGAPITLEENDTASIVIRMPRFGSIVGTLFDENGVALPEHEVAAFNNQRPPRLLTHAKTDDRGMYRLYGLPPGKYLVRSLAKMYDDDGYVPTFYRDTARVSEAIPVTVALDQQVEHIDLHPLGGRLLNVTGRTVLPGYSGIPSVTLSADTGAITVGTESNGTFAFPVQAPGQYDLYAYVGADRGRPPMAAFSAITLDRDLDARLTLAPFPSVGFLIEDLSGSSIDSRNLRVMVRRKELSGVERPEWSGDYRPDGSKVALPPGRWEAALMNNPGYYVARVVDPAGVAVEFATAGWNDFILTAGTQNVVRLTLGATGSLAGVVRSTAGEVTGGLPVFLEPSDLPPHKRLVEVVSVVTNPKGQFQFAGLAPGNYRLLATREYPDPAAAEFDAANAVQIKVESGKPVNLELAEWVIR